MKFPIQSRVAAIRDLSYPGKTIAQGSKGTVTAAAHLPNDSTEYYKVAWDTDKERYADEDDLTNA
jgi:hypothetical protein